MPKAVYELSNDEIKENVQWLAHKLLKEKHITRYQYNILLSMLSRHSWAWSEKESTNQWAIRAYDEVERLTKLITERWEAGWRGNEENAGR